MSFAEKELPELREVIKNFVGDDEAESVNSVPEAVKLLDDEGVTFEDYSKWQEIENAREDAEEAVEPAKKAKETAKKARNKPGNTDIVVKMQRPNMTYEIRGHRFTREHPYVVMSESEAQALFDLDGQGFRVATPREVQEYYS